MGTSSPYGGPGGGTPLIPTWLEPINGAYGPADGSAPGNDAPDSLPPAPLDRPIPKPSLVPARFQSARGNFSRFARSGGSNRASLGRAIAGYISKASGGAHQAALHMGSSRSAGAKLLGFLSVAQTRGAREALRSLDLEGLAGQPIEDIFLGLADYVCPESGAVDEGIARDAFIETIVDLASFGITDLDTLTPDQMQTVFELYASHAIENRLCNAIGMNLVILPSDIHAAEQVQAQLRDFVRRGVADALTAARAELRDLTPDRALDFVDKVYEAAFEILLALGEKEAKGV